MINIGPTGVEMIDPILKMQDQKIVLLIPINSTNIKPKPSYHNGRNN